MKPVKFDALIKKIEVKSLMSLDRGARMILDFNADDDELIADLIRKQKADELVKVQIG